MDSRKSSVAPRHAKELRDRARRPTMVVPMIPIRSAPVLASLLIASFAASAAAKPKSSPVRTGAVYETDGPYQAQDLGEGQCYGINDNGDVVGLGRDKVPFVVSS